MEETLFDLSGIEQIIKDTRRGILSLRAMAPIFTQEEWDAQTQEIKKGILPTQMQCDNTIYLQGKNDHDIGVLGIVELRERISYLFELVLWCDPRDIEDQDWSLYDEQLKWCLSLAAGTKEPLPAVATVHNIAELDGVIKDIIDTYLDPAMEGTPWKLAVSWGKDSTCMVKAILEALSQLNSNQWQRPIHLVTSDTSIEIPLMLNIMRKNMKDMAGYIESTGLPVFLHMVQPTMPERFFVNLIGKGYTPPMGGPVKRWCTSRLKLKPMQRLEKELAYNGQMINVIGTRYDESASRETSIKKFESNTRYGYTTSPGIYSYAPIVQLTTEKVWDYLREGLPWGNNYQILEELYRASSLDDSLINGGRMGCITCFAVSKDKSLANLIANGYEWLQPLLEYRQIILDTVANPIYREPVPIDRRTALPTTRKARNPAKVTMGGINQLGRQYLLHRLLETQDKVLAGMKQAGFEVEGGYQIISTEEIRYIKSWWNWLSSYTEPGLIPVEVIKKPDNRQMALF